MTVDFALVFTVLSSESLGPEFEEGQSWGGEGKLTGMSPELSITFLEFPATY
jgi:hypothetical protein